LGTTLTSQNSIQEENKSKFYSGRKQIKILFRKKTNQNSIQEEDKSKFYSGRKQIKILFRKKTNQNSIQEENKSKFYSGRKQIKILFRKKTNQSSIQEESMSRLKPRNACYNSVQDLLSSTLLSKNLKIKIYRIIVLPVFVWV